MREINIKLMPGTRRIHALLTHQRAALVVQRQSEEVKEGLVLDRDLLWIPANTLQNDNVIGLIRKAILLFALGVKWFLAAALAQLSTNVRDNANVFSDRFIITYRKLPGEIH